MTSYQQPALFPDSDITGTGRPTEWPLPVIEPLSAELTPQSDELPFADATEGEAA